MDIKKAIDIIEWLYEDGNTLSKEAKEALETAIDSLEKQVPKKPAIDELLIDHKKILLCRNCNEEINVHYSFCPWCGQKIDWE